jgi:uncharacterized membrane protein
LTLSAIGVRFQELAPKSPSSSQQLCDQTLTEKESTMDTTTPPPVASTGTAMPPAVSAAEDKTVAIVSYITLIGFIAAIVINSNKKTKLGAFHLRQMLGLYLTSFVCIIPILGWILAIAIFVFWIMGLISATKGEMKPVPLLGGLHQKWFGNAFD